VEKVEEVEKPKKKVELLMCRCAGCSHWEIGRVGERRFLLCKTCGLEVPIIHFKVDDHHMLHYQEHER
jgi:hypothetical protein